MTSAPTASDVSAKDGNLGRHTGPAARVGIGVLHIYQAWSATRPPHCRYDPTCSQYAVEAMQEWGFFKGAWLAARRVGRCHPWGGMGYDPVPQRSVGTDEESVG